MEEGKHHTSPQDLDQLIDLLFGASSEAEYWEMIGSAITKVGENVETWLPRLAKSSSYLRRAIAADIAGVVGARAELTPSMVDLLGSMLGQELDPNVVLSIAHALARFISAESSALLYELRNHPDPAVRVEVAKGLFRCLAAQVPHSSAASASLARLAHDQDDEVSQIARDYLKRLQAPRAPRRRALL